MKMSSKFYKSVFQMVEYNSKKFSEICAASRVSKKEIGRCFKLIIKSLETSLEQITSADFMVRLLGLSLNFRFRN